MLDRSFCYRLGQGCCKQSEVWFKFQGFRRLLTIHVLVIFELAVLCLTALLIDVVDSTEDQRYDGWYNNRANPFWGAAGENVILHSPSAFSDFTYLPSGERRPNARHISNQVLRGPSGLPSYQNRTTLFVFFGQMVSYELVHATDSSCPVELLKIPITADDVDFTTNSTTQQYLPFVRSLYNHKTGRSPNRPRQAMNKASSWIDGSFIYGKSEVWANSLRLFSGGLLATQVSAPDFPANNTIQLPLDNYPSPITQIVTRPEDLWMTGDPHSHQNPGLLLMSLVWFRYHNSVARRIGKEHPDWKDQRIFCTARRYVIATLQNIVMYEWLPALLNQTTAEYKGYHSTVHPGITGMFEAVAMRVGHSLVPPGLYIRGKSCKFAETHNGAGVRLCNSYWNSQKIIQQFGVDDLTRGMMSQLCEREDHIMVDDLRGKVFGPLHYTRHDLAVLTLMRGRDHGLPDYNSARKAYGLQEIRNWAEINPWLNTVNPQALERLRDAYNGSLRNVDPYPAGLMESTPDSIGPLFTAVIFEQFLRIRDGDRFWFENLDNRLFSRDEILKIRGIRFKDVLLASTQIASDEIQDSVFFWKKGDPCPQPKQLEQSDLTPCSPHRGFDYFAGSEVSYITAFTCLALLPFVCILVAYSIAKFQQLMNRRRMRLQNLNAFCKSSSDEPGAFHALEWLDDSGAVRHVELYMSRDQCSLCVTSDQKVVLRSIDMERHAKLKIWLSSDKHRNHLTLHIPHEYDLVLRFRSERVRAEFVSNFREFLRNLNKTLLVHEGLTKELFSRAMTRQKRQNLITAFFRSIFAEAHITKEVRHPDDFELHQCKEIVDCELTRAEFAEALALKPDSLFVNQMFSLIDRDKNGYISFRELLYTVLLFAKGSCEDKLHILFLMYDRDQSESLSRSEVTEMIRSLMEMANSSLDHEQVDLLVDKMFLASGMERSNSLRFKDFTRVLGNRMDMLWDVCLDWKGTKICFPKQKSGSRRDKQLDQDSSSHAFGAAAEPSITSFTRRAVMLKNLHHYFENHRQQIVYLFIFFSICALLFAERFYRYAVEQEHRGWRSIAGYGVSLTRGAAAGMSFAFSLLLLTMCRNVITKLRETVLNLYIPFDYNVVFHKVVAYTALFFSMLHIIGYCFNFYHVATQPVEFLCVFDEMYFRSDFLPKIHFWLFQTIPGFTGILLVIIICIIYIFATATARIHIFNAFWITHQLFYALYVLTVLHGSVRVVQEPYFSYYLFGPAVLFTFDKLVSLSRKKCELSVLRVELLPSDVTLLEFKRPINFDFRSGQWIRLACAPLGKDEYHSLTLTSAPHEATLTVHVRAVGPWSTNLRKIFDPNRFDGSAFPKVYVDGPFGAGQQDWINYDVSVLVGGGIGVTPYASILKDFVFLTSVKNTFRMKCHKVYFIWVTASQKHYEWLIDILNTLEQVDKKEVVEIHIFITQLFSQFDLRTTMLYICEEHFQRMSGRSIFTGLKARTHFGRPNFEKVLNAVHLKHPRVRKVGVFSCGPPGLTKGVENACLEASSKNSKTAFEHHFENF